MPKKKTKKKSPTPRRQRMKRDPRLKAARGHFCWCCERHLPNEKFSGRGHSRHLCRECSRLGAEELEYRSHVRNIDRLFTWEGRLRRKQRKTFERYLAHPNKRVQQYARELADFMDQERAQYQDLLEKEADWADQAFEHVGEKPIGSSGRLDPFPDDEQIPF